MISIGDSYWWGFTYTGITENVFEKDNYWFYFRDRMENEHKKGLVADVNLKDQLFSQDMVILMVTEATYQLFPYGFIESFFRNCMPVNAEVRQMKIEGYIIKIRNDPAWYQSVLEKAGKNGKSIEEQVKLDAEYMVDQEEKKQ